MGGPASRVFAGTIGDLRRMSEWFQGLAAAAGLDPDTAWQAEVCLNEAASNIILYGYDDGVPHPITLEIDTLERGVRMTIVDDGRPFNPAEPRELPVVHTVEEMAVGGLGLHREPYRAGSDVCRRSEPRGYWEAGSGNRARVSVTSGSIGSARARATQ